MIWLVLACNQTAPQRTKTPQHASPQRTVPELELEAVYTLHKPQDDDAFGGEVDGGDINGDGFDDAMTTARYRDGVGAAYIYFGSVSGLSSEYVELKVEGQDYYGDIFAFSVTAVDLNGDGASEVVGSSPARSFEAQYSGVVHLLEMDASGSFNETILTPPAPNERGYFGADVANARDINDDGYDDLIVTELNQLDGVGGLYMYFGSASGISSTPASSYFSHAELDGHTGFGVACDGLGDTNGDGYDDALVGAAGVETKGRGNIGEAYFYLGSASGLQPAQTIVVPNVDSAISFGDQVSWLGDVNGDGYNDALISDPASGARAGYGGEVFVYYGSISGIRSTDYESVYNPDISSFSWFGSASSGVGDIDGDGFTDFAAKVENSDPKTGKSRLFIYFGSSTGVSEAYLPISAAEDALSFVGIPGYVGDTNADGYDDLFFGASGADYGGTYYYLGAPEDVDRDGVGKPDDCDDNDPTVGRGTLSYPDTDGDGYGDPAAGDYLCATEAGWGEDSADCDDQDASVSPDAAEVCGDGIDNDCDGFGTDADDEDSDGLSGKQERAIGTDLCDEDTDGDGLSDGDEVNRYSTDPLDEDTDGDGVNDGDEVSDGTDPLLDEDAQDTAEPGTGEPVEDPTRKETKETGCRGTTQAGVLLGLLWGMTGRRRLAQTGCEDHGVTGKSSGQAPPHPLL